MRKAVILVILDGVGIGRKDESNPVHTANPENLNFIETNFPAGALQAHGTAVGLPWEHPGNSKIGHLAIGAGRTPHDDHRAVSNTVENGTFFENSCLNDAFKKVRERNSLVHLIGPLSENPEDASLSHITALLELAKKHGIENVRLHLFLDKTSLPLIKSLGEPATVSGRFYGLDETRDWGKTALVYNCIAGGAGRPAQSMNEALAASKKAGLTPELTLPTVIGEPFPMGPGDAVIFFNLEESGMFQLASPFLIPDFGEFPIAHPKDLNVQTFLKHPEADFGSVAFPHLEMKNTLSHVIAENDKSQIKITETVKQIHLNYFLNGRQREPCANEFRVVIPSRQSPHPETAPAMMAGEITDRVLMSLHENSFDFIAVNYPNADFITHTGNIGAVQSAVSSLDKEIGRLVKPVLTGGHTLIVTADHGNAEAIVNPKTGLPESQHSKNPVPFYVVNKVWQRPRVLPPAGLPTIGIISDIAPTILALMELSPPPEMTGENLLNQII